MNCHTVDRSFLTRVELIVLFAFIALGAAILAPELLRADIASDEAQAIADARTVYRAEEAYAAANFGFYSNVTNLCRSGPECSGIGIPGYPATAPEFLPADFGRNLAVRQRRLFPQLGRRLWVQSHPRLGGSQQRDGLLLHHESRSVDGRVAARVRHRWLGAHVLRPDRSGNRMSDTLRHGFARSARPALAVDFGLRGLWRYDGNDGWIRLARSNPVLVRARGETLLATFKGKKGLYHLDDAGWTRIAK